MDFIDLKTQQKKIKPELDKRIAAVLEHGQYILGPEIDELESRLAEYVGVKHCIGVSSGTDALLIPLLAYGIGPGDEVIVPAFSFFATCEVVALLGAKPVFVDVEKGTCNMSISSLKDSISNRTKAIMPVSLYGQCSDMDEIREVAGGIPIIEDAAQSFGATYKGKKSCALSEVGATSFFPSKPLGGYGDAGALFTDDDSLAKTMREISRHGDVSRYSHSRIGINGRLDTLQAAVLNAKFDIFPREVEERLRIGNAYIKKIENLNCGVTTLEVKEDRTSVFGQFTIRVSDRDGFRKHMDSVGIPTAVHYPSVLPDQVAIADTDCNVPNSRELSGEVVSLPMHPYLSENDQDKIVEEIASFFK